MPGTFVGRLKLNRHRKNRPERSPTLGRPRGTGYMSFIEKSNGGSYRHPSGYVPVYKGETDLAALRRGVDDYGRRTMLRDNPYTTWRERESWTDGWLWAAGRDCPFKPAATGEKWKLDGRVWRPSRTKAGAA